MKRTLPLKEIGYFTLDSTKNSSLYSGNVASHTDVVLPIACHNSSAICGANGANIIVNGSKIARLWHLADANSFAQIMNADTEVLKEKFSIS